MNKQVTKQEFYKFISKYPTSLETDITHIYEPPLKTWNDFTKGEKWPDSVVGFCKLFDGSEYHDHREPEYYLIEKP